MKILLQRVSSAKVITDCGFEESINYGLLGYLSFEKEDLLGEVEQFVDKLLKLKLINRNEKSKGLQKISDSNDDILVIPSITLSSRLKKNKFDFKDALDPASARTFFNKFVETLKGFYKGKVVTGKFQSYMKISSEVIGPENYLMDKKDFQRVSSQI